MPLLRKSKIVYVFYRRVLESPLFSNLFLLLWTALKKVSHSCVLVVSPLNAIISDRIEKLKERGVGVKVLKDQFVSIDDTVKFVYGHAEAFVGNQSVRTLLRSSFKDRVKAVVIDEAHFIVQW